VDGLASPALSSPPNQCALVATFGTASIVREATNITSVIVRVLEIVIYGDAAPT
jgi:hypothetical protein